MPSELGSVRWRGSWSPETPVKVMGPDRMTLYLSVEDAVYRIRSAYPLDTKPSAEHVERTLRERSVHGMTFLTEGPNAHP